MSPQTALYVYLLLILWLLYRDIRFRQGVSHAIWLVLLWVAIIASRPVSAWLSLGAGAEMSGSDAEGDALDRNVFLILIGVGLVILKRRNLKWKAVISLNRPLFVLYLFFAISVAWSPEPFVALKRWFKDIGNIVMVLVLLTEESPLDAIRAVFVRCAYVLIPLSVLFVKYYTWLGKGYSRVTGEMHYNGVALGKNELGATMLFVTLFLLWDLIQRFRASDTTVWWKRLLGPCLVLVMALYLLRMAHSATAVACALLGASGLLFLMLPSVRKTIANLSAFSILGVLLLFLLASLFDLKGQVAAMLGRDPSLTGRDVIWKAVLAEGTNPLIGTGFNSFWMGTRSQDVSQKQHLSFNLNQAHNGYLELYLHGGAIGVCLLLVMLLKTGKRIRQQLLADPGWTSARLVLWFIVIIYNWSEAAFFKLSPLWFVLLTVILEAPRRPAAALRSTLATDVITTPTCREKIPSMYAPTA